MAAITAIASGAAALGSAIYGAIASAKYNNKARQLIQQQRDDNKRWYDTKMNEDYTQRTDAQNVINRQRELLNERYKQARATNVVAGGTDESVAMQKAAANDAMAQTMSDIAANASAYKEGVENAYRQQDQALNQQQAQTYANQGAATAQAAGQAVNAGVNMVGIGLQNNAQKEIDKIEKKNA